MNITVNRAALRTALALATTVADKRSTVPALSCALLRADKSVTITASDLSLTYFSDIECTVKTPGAIVLGAKGLYDIVSSLSVDEVTIREIDGKAEIRAGKSRFQVGTQPAEHFPKMPDVGSLKFVTVDAVALIRMIQGVIGCVSEDLNRTVLAGVHLDLSKSEAMSSDGHRAAIFRASLGAKLERIALVPRAGAMTILKTIGDAKEVDITFNGDSIFVRTGKSMLAAKLLEAEFPAGAVGQFARSTSAHEVTIPRVAFLESLKRMALATTKELHGVRISVAPGRASLSASSAGAISEDEIDVGYEGKGYEIAFSVPYAIAALETLSAEEVMMGIGDGFDPIVLRPLAEDMGEEHALVIMPMRF